MHRRWTAGRVRPQAALAYVSARLPLLDEFRPHVWRTEDYGETWTRIVDGIRDDACVNSVREDPSREGLLYAGTNHGVYVTYEDGGWWQELNPGLPDLPVTDVIPEHEELAMASHGRGFWVLDNVARLAEADDDETLIPAAERLRAALDEIEGEIYQMRNRSNQDPLNFPTKVNNRLANLLSMSERGDGRPGSGMYELFEIKLGRLEGLFGGGRRGVGGGVGKVNTALERLGVGGIGVGKLGGGTERSRRQSRE